MWEDGNRGTRDAGIPYEFWQGSHVIAMHSENVPLLEKHLEDKGEVEATLGAYLLSHTVMYNYVEHKSLKFVSAVKMKVNSGFDSFVVDWIVEYLTKLD